MCVLCTGTFTHGLMPHVMFTNFVCARVENGLKIIKAILRNAEPKLGLFVLI